MTYYFPRIESYYEAFIDDLGLYWYNDNTDFLLNFVPKHPRHIVVRLDRYGGSLSDYEATPEQLKKLEDWKVQLL